MQTLKCKKIVFLAIMLHGLSEFWKSALQLVIKANSAWPSFQAPSMDKRIEYGDGYSHSYGSNCKLFVTAL